jgi:hypothetical protein
VGRESGDVEELMATQPKPKPRPEPPKPGDPDDENAATTSPVVEEPPQTNTNASGNSLTDRVDALFTSQVALIERVEKLEERVAAPPVGIGRRP